MRSLASPAVWVLAAVWAGLAVYGFIAFTQLEPEGSGFTRGTNRVYAFLRWEIYALIAAFAASFAGRAAQAAGATKLVSRLPIWISGGAFALATAAFVGLIIYTRVF